MELEELEVERSISFLSLGTGAVVPSPSSLPHAKPFDSSSIDTRLSLSLVSDSSQPDVPCDASLSLSTNISQTEKHGLEAQKAGEDVAFSENEIFLFGFKIKAEDSASSSSSVSSVAAAVHDNQLVQNQNPQVNMGFPQLKLGLQETSKAIKRRVYTRPRRAVIKEHSIVRRAEHASSSYKENTGELLIEKVLTKSDIDQSSRLLLSKDKVEKHLIPILPEADQQRCRSLAGLSIQFYDADNEEEISHTLVLKQWKTKSYVFTGTWRKDFVKRRNLHENDEVGLFWDRNLSRFNFSVKKIR